jgi:tetratricopeptide (TPR) repeat protein
MFDPVDWAVVIGGVVLFVRAWRLGADALQILPHEDQVFSTARTSWSRALIAATVLYALVLLGFAGTSRYQASAYLLQPGVDSKREQEALLALNQGIAHADRGDLGSAERSWQRSLQLWEELAARPSAPSAYRVSLTQTLYNLGWVNHRQGRLDLTEKYYARAVALGDELAGDPEMFGELKQCLSSARQTLTDLRNDKSGPLLDEKDRAARAKYEEAQVKALSNYPRTLVTLILPPPCD